MFGSGHLQGRLVVEPELVSSVLSELAALIEPSAFAAKYQLKEGTPRSYSPWATATTRGDCKAIWEELKPSVGMDHPARYALVEIVNLHDPAIIFEAIHRFCLMYRPTFCSSWRTRSHRIFSLSAA
jgi:hypothetical protein